MQIERILPRRGINDKDKGKKYALYALISASKADYVWMQDDDIIPPVASDEEVLQTMGDADLLILPLRMVSPHPFPSLIERLQIAEYAAIQQLTIETAARQHAVMCSGANLVVRRQRWLESYPDIHPEIPSGDDMFLLESFKRRRLTIRTLSPRDIRSGRMTAIVQPENTPRALFRQRMRWAGKAPSYTDRDIILCGIIVALANIFQFLFPPFILLKFPIDYALIRKNDPSVSIGIAFLLALLYPYYMLICLVGGIYHTYHHSLHTTKKTW